MPATRSPSFRPPLFRSPLFRSLTVGLLAVVVAGFAQGPLAGTAWAGDKGKRPAKVSEGKAGITISSMNKGAKVFIDDKEIGEVPLPGVIEVEPGRRNIRVQKRGFTPYIDTVLPSLGQIIEVEVDLVPSGGFLKATSKDAGLKLQLLIDGTIVGFTPFDGDVAPGEHTVEARAAGYLPESQHISVKAGQDTVLEFGLKVVPAPIIKEDKSIFSRWWFWTAVGAVVVGGVATGVAVSQDTHVRPKPADYVLPLGN